MPLPSSILPETLPSDPTIFEGIGNKLAWYALHADATTILAGSLVLLALLFAAKIYGSRMRALPADLRVIRPPLNLSPSAMRYLLNRGMDSKTPVVTMLDAVVKGCYRIVWRTDGFIAEKVPWGDFTSMSAADREALSFSKNQFWEKVQFSRSPNGITRRMSERLDAQLHRRYRKYFRKNWGWLILGILLSASLLIGAYTAFLPSHSVKWFFGYLFVFMLCVILPTIFLMQVARDKYWFGIFYSILFMVVGIGTLIYIESRPESPIFSLGVIPFAALHIFIARHLPAYTPTGRKLMQYIFAYRLHLKDRFDRVAAGELEMKRVVEEIPYALALDLDYNFTRFFSPLLDKTRYEPYQIFNQIYGGQEKSLRIV